MDKSEILRKQILISSVVVSKDYEFSKEIIVDDRLRVYVGKDLNYRTGKRDDGSDFIIAGDLISHIGAIDEVFDLLCNTKGSIENIDSDWTGRWLYLDNEVIVTDPCGLFGLWYYHSSSQFLCSTSSKILSLISSSELAIELKIKQGLASWPFLPGPDEGIKRLLPTQYINAESFRPIARSVILRDYFSLSDREVTDRTSKYLLSLVKSLKGSRLLVPLSAGLDSRLIASIVKSANLDFSTYTFLKENSLTSNDVVKTSAVSYSDLTLPHIISELLNVPHKYITPKEFNLTLYENYVRFSDGLVHENDLVYYAKSQWDQLDKNRIILLGQVAELGSLYYSELLADIDSSDGSADQLESALNRVFNPEGHSVVSLSINSYCKYLHSTKYLFPDAVKLSERIYLEQRLAGWCSNLQQSLDITGTTRIHLFSSKVMISLFLSQSDKAKKERSSFKEIIMNLTPELRTIPVNPKDPFFYSIKKFIYKIINTNKQAVLIKFKEAVKRLLKIST